MSQKITAANTFEVLKRHILVDGFPIVVDLEKSRGCHLVDQNSGKKYFDFFSFYASNPVGINHASMNEPEFVNTLIRCAKIKPVLADVYTPEYATFVNKFAEMAGRGHFSKYFFIEGGALANENALKAAFDWKVRKNIAKGKGEKGTKVIHFQQAFHGRSGYTMSITNTDPKKTMYFPKFDWPRIINPKKTFPFDEAARQQVIEIEKLALTQIQEAFDKNPKLENLLLDEYFKTTIEKAQAGWRRVVATAITNGVPAPCLATSLTYFDGFRSERLPANLLQAQRDYFGAHTYERVDKPRGEFFHTNWTGRGGDTASSTYKSALRRSANPRGRPFHKPERRSLSS